MSLLSHGTLTSISQIALAPSLRDRDIAREFNPEFQKRLLRLCNEMHRRGYHFDIGSGLRRVATQRMQQRINPYAAKGLHSKHLYGCAADVLHVRTDGRSDAAFYRDLHIAARQYGLEPIHGRLERSHIQIPNHEFFPGLHNGRFPILVSVGTLAHEIFDRRHHGHGHRHHHRHHHGWRHASGHTTHHHHRHHHSHRPRPEVREYQPEAVPA